MQEAVVALGRLITRNIVPTDTASVILVQLVRQDNPQVKKYVRYVLKTLRASDAVAVDAVIIGALKQLYEDMARVESQLREIIHHDFVALGDALARSFGPPLRTDPAMRQLGNGVLLRGIEFALQDAPQNVAFLDALLPFVTRMHPLDVAPAAAALKDAATDAGGADDEAPAWDPYRSFAEALDAHVHGPEKRKPSARKSRGSEAGFATPTPLRKVRSQV